MQQGNRGFSKPIRDQIHDLLDALEPSLRREKQLHPILSHLNALLEADFIRDADPLSHKNVLESLYTQTCKQRNLMVTSWCVEHKTTHQSFHSLVLNGPAHIPPLPLKKLLKAIYKLYADCMLELERVFAP